MLFKANLAWHLRADAPHLTLLRFLHVAYYSIEWWSWTLKASWGWGPELKLRARALSESAWCCCVPFRTNFNAKAWLALPWLYCPQGLMISETRLAHDTIVCPVKSISIGVNGTLDKIVSELGGKHGFFNPSVGLHCHRCNNLDL